MVSGWAEDFQLEPLPDGGTRMTYRMALERRLLRLVKIPKRWQPAINRYNEQAPRQDPHDSAGARMTSAIGFLERLELAGSFGSGGGFAGA